jgi:hypothetical protein
MSAIVTEGLDLRSTYQKVADGVTTTFRATGDLLKELLESQSPFMSVKDIVTVINLGEVPQDVTQRFLNRQSRLLRSAKIPNPGEFMSSPPSLFDYAVNMDPPQELLMEMIQHEAHDNALARGMAIRLRSRVNGVPVDSSPRLVGY